MLARTWSRRWKQDSWTQHLFGRMLKLSHTHILMRRYTFSLGDIPASPSVMPANDSEQTTLDTSGHSSQTELDLCDQECASSRTSQGISRLDSPASSATWKNLVIAARLESSRREKLARLISENESSYLLKMEIFDSNLILQRGQDDSLPDPDNLNTTGKCPDLWATPQAWDHVEIIRKPEDRTEAANKGGCSNLREQVVNWPTPNASDPNQGGTTQGQRKSPNLSIAALNWGTPTARDHKSGRGIKKRTYMELTAMVERQQLGRLSPMWVEQMMGLSPGWTGCDFSATELSPPPRSLPLEPSTIN
jgi:hypothetical protein